MTKGCGKGMGEGYGMKGMHDTREHRWIVMKSFGLLWLPWPPNDGGQMQDRERVVVQKEI